MLESNILQVANVSRIIAIIASEQNEQISLIIFLLRSRTNRKKTGYLKSKNTATRFVYSIRPAILRNLFRYIGQNRSDRKRGGKNKSVTRSDLMPKTPPSILSTRSFTLYNTFPHPICAREEKRNERNACWTRLEYERSPNSPSSA